MQRNANLWSKIIGKQKEIILAMNVARVINEDHRFTDEKVFIRNGYMDSDWARIPVTSVLSYKNTSYLPHVWAKIMVEFAKPFIPGLTKKMAPALRQAYIRVCEINIRKKNEMRNKLEQREKIAYKQGELASHQILHGHDDANFTKKPTVNTPDFYIKFLRKKLRNKEFAKRFVDKYVIPVDLGRLTGLTDEHRGRSVKTVYERNVLVRNKKLIIFQDHRDLTLLTSQRRLDISMDHDVMRMIQAKAAERLNGAYFRGNFVLCKYRNRLYIAVY